jgi:hypothetical protein
MASWHGLAFDFPLSSRFTLVMIGTGLQVKGMLADLMLALIIQPNFGERRVRVECGRNARFAFSD